MEQETAQGTAPTRRRPGRSVPVDRDKLRAARLQADLTIDELATVTGMSPTHIGGVERGTHGISQAALRVLAAAVGVQTPALLLEGN